MAQSRNVIEPFLIFSSSLRSARQMADDAAMLFYIKLLHRLRQFVMRKIDYVILSLQVFH